MKQSYFHALAPLPIPSGSNPINLLYMLLEQALPSTTQSYLQQCRAIAEQFTRADYLNAGQVPGVLAGLAGKALFLLHYAQLHGEQAYYNLGHAALERALEAAHPSPDNHTYCSGLAGLGWTLMHLHEQHLLDLDGNELLEDLDGYLVETLSQDLAHGNYDFLHGALGTALYFLKRTRYTPEARPVLQSFVREMEALSIRKGEMVQWESVLLGQGKRGYNISLSHGMSSIVALLSKLYAAGIERERIGGMLQGTIHYILRQQLDTTRYTSCFPSYSLETEGEPGSSRLAWCYGDLGIASALWLAGQAVGHRPWQHKAVEVFLHASKRTDVQEAGVMDASLCHGSAGIAHIFNRAYQHTHLAAFQTARDYWLDQTIRMAASGAGLGGYKTYAGKQEGYKTETNLLEGIAGVGLAFMAAAAGHSYAQWDECLLLS
jgi:lantibiotic modifying enzyme